MMGQQTFSSAGASSGSGFGGGGGAQNFNFDTKEFFRHFDAHRQNFKTGQKNPGGGGAR